MKKLVSILGAGAMLLSVVTPVLARGGRNHHSQPAPLADVNVAAVRNTTSASANTGDNYVGNYATVKKANIGGEVEVEGRNNLTTRAADADATGVVVANTQVGCSNCGRTSSPLIQGNVALVDNSTNSNANTGFNTVGNTAEVEQASVGGHHRGGEVEVGGNNNVVAGPADSSATGVVVVNTQWNH